MKLFSLLLTLLMPLSLLATDCIPDCDCETDWTLEVRAAYYYPSSKLVRNVYSNGWLDYQVAATKRVSDFLEVWGEVDWSSKHGNVQPYSYGFKDRTRIAVLPVSLGLKVIYPILPCVDVYLGAGACYSFLEIKNRCAEHYSYWNIRSPFKRLIHKSGAGALFKIGFQFAMSKSTFLDFFVDYYSQRFHFSRKENLANRSIFKHYVNCSGWKLGAGFGVYF